MIKIVTDSTCDLPPDVIQELGITVIPLYINIGEKGFLDGLEITRQEFYTNLPDYETHPTTSLPSIPAFTQVYEDLASETGTEILSIHVAESLSGTVGVAHTAASQVDLPVTVRDSGQLSLGLGFQVEAAARMANEGKTMAEILEALDDIGDRTFLAAGLQTLEYLRRSGRMNSLMSGLGSMLKLKPILTMHDGLAGSERVRTSSKARGRLIEMLRDQQPLERFALVHANAPNEAKHFYSQIKDLVPDGEVYSMDITPVIGVHVGPGVVGYVIISKEPISN